MATYTHLAGWDVNVVKGQEFEEKDGQTVAIETWNMIFTEQKTGNQIRFAVRKEARDELVKQLTGGVILA